MDQAISKVIEGNWDEFKGKARQKWAKLSDDDIEFAKGSYEKFKGKLKKAYGKYEDDKVLEQEIGNFLKAEGLITLKNKAEELWESAKDVSENVGRTVQRSAKQIKDKSSDIQEDVVEYVKTNPVKSVGFALLIGMVLSKIIKK